MKSLAQKMMKALNLDHRYQLCALKNTEDIYFIYDRLTLKRTIYNNATTKLKELHCDVVMNPKIKYDVLGEGCSFDDIRKNNPEEFI